MKPNHTALTLLALVAATSTASAGAALVSGKVTGTAVTEAVVYIEKAAAPPPADPTRPKMAQRNTEFAPGSVVVVQGQKVDFPNEDKVFHNVFSPTPGNEFDLGLYRGGISKSVQMQEPGEVEVFCNIHPNMSAKILVLQNGYFARAAADGSFSLANVPPGRYVLVAWSPNHEPVKKSIVVAASGVVKADFNLGARRDAGSHLNKNGEQYGRYK